MIHIEVSHIPKYREAIVFPTFSNSTAFLSPKMNSTMLVDAWDTPSFASLKGYAFPRPTL